MLKTKNHLIKFVHLQLFITLISIPILLCWGMPISLLTFAGNFFFSPILTAFLLLSSLIFFCQIMHIPNGILIYCLEGVCAGWLWLMQWADKNFLIALALPSLPIIILIPVGALAILHHKKINSAWKGIACYSLLLLSVCGYLKLSSKTMIHLDVLSCNKGIITFVTADNQLALIDPGVIGRRLSAPSWCEYTLMPHLAKKYGTTTIDHFIILQPNRIIFDALWVLQEKINIKKIYIPFWEGKLPFYWWRSYAKLRQQCKEKGCALKYLGKKPVSISLDTTTTFIITPLEQMILMDGFSYPCFQVQATVDNTPLQIYSAKYKIPSLKKKDHNGTTQSINDNRP